MAHQLSSGAIQRMVNNDTSISPRLQVLDVKKIVTGQQGERYRLVLSDGQFYIQGMLSTQCSALVSNNQLKKWCIIHLKEFVCNQISGRKICVVINCEVVTQMNAGIGQPQNALNPNSSSNNNAQQQNRPPPVQNQQAFHQRNFQQNSNQNNYGGNNNNNRSSNNGNANGQVIQPVSSLNPYQNNWKIKVRCTNKEAMRHYHNQKGDGKLFSVDLLDKDGTEIRATAFNDAAEKFFSIFEKNKVFLISRGQVRLARKGYSSIKNDYSITLNSDAEVVPVHDNDNSIEAQKYKFAKISSIEQMDKNTFVDIIGVITDVGPVTSLISSRTQKELKKRSIKVADQSAKIEVTLWNEMAENFDENVMNDNPNPVVALKGCKVSHFGGRSLSASGVMEFHPNKQETRELIQWAQSFGGSGPKVSDLTSGQQGVSSNAPRLTFGEVKEMNLGSDSESKMDKKKADYFTAVATITTIAQSQDKKPWYEANPDLNCATAKNAKVVPMGDGQYRCEKNGKVYNSYIPRYILRFCATDFTGNIWLTAFNEAAEQILKKTAVEAENLSQNQPEEYERLFKQSQFKKYVFKCKATSDYYEDSHRIRYDVMAAQLVNPVEESEKLVEKIAAIQKLKAQSGY
jgi:replication factor A1